MLQWKHYRLMPQRGIGSFLQIIRNRVTVIGAGPAGITAAACLSQRGLKVDIFEAKGNLRGLILYGIQPDKVDKREALRVGKSKIFIEGEL